MRLVSSDGERLVFHLGKREAALLKLLLQQYPLVPESHFAATRAGTDPKLEETRRLLADAVAAQRAENRRELEAWLNRPDSFAPHKDGFRVCLTQSQIEWLFQILNDVRVGSWLRLGSPDPRDGVLTVKDKSEERHAITMELAGYFESRLLEALEGRSGTA
jgi:hypothetical protein